METGHITQHLCGKVVTVPRLSGKDDAQPPRPAAQAPEMQPPRAEPGAGWVEVDRTLLCVGADLSSPGAAYAVLSFSFPQ